MAFRVSGKNIDVGDALRARISERIDELLTRYFDRGYSGHATVGKEGFGFRTECAVHLDSGVVLQAEAWRLTPTRARTRLRSALRSGFAAIAAASSRTPTRASASRARSLWSTPRAT
jgi:ribosome-associated translation inhibitor RaiA